MLLQCTRTALCIGVFARIALALSCDFSVWRACWSDIESFITRPKTSSAVIPFYTDAELNFICGRSLKQAENCSAPLRAVCSRAEIRVHDGVERAAMFICNEGWRSYQDIRGCLSQPKVTEEGLACNSTYFKSLKDLRSDQKSLKAKQERLCGYIDGFIGCLSTTAEKHCGTESSIWLKNLHNELLKPSREEIGCRGNDGMGAPLIFGTIIGVSMSFLSFGAVCLYYHRRLAKNSSNSKNNSTTSKQKGADTELLRVRARDKRPNSLTHSSVQLIEPKTASLFPSNYDVSQAIPEECASNGAQVYGSGM